MRSECVVRHERWDGTGYPRALKGEDIPLAGRIVAICDLFDALTTARPYKKPWSVEDTTTELERDEGAHFDPALVDLFETILPRICEIRDNLLEQ